MKTIASVAVTFAAVFVYFGVVAVVAECSYPPPCNEICLEGYTYCHPKRFVNGSYCPVCECCPKKCPVPPIVACLCLAFDYNATCEEGYVPCVKDGVEPCFCPFNDCCPRTCDSTTTPPPPPTKPPPIQDCGTICDKACAKSCKKGERPCPRNGQPQPAPPKKQSYARSSSSSSSSHAGTSCESEHTTAAPICHCPFCRCCKIR